MPQPSRTSATPRPAADLRPPPPAYERTGTQPRACLQGSRVIMRLVNSSTPDPLDFRTVRHAYDTVAEDYATYLPDTCAEAPLDLAMIDAFAEAVTSGDDARVLDAGCGAGRMSRYLAGRGCLVEGVDLSSRMVALARRDHPGRTFTVGSLTELPYPDDQFA